jgi:cytochrome c
MLCRCLALAAAVIAALPVIACAQQLAVQESGLGRQIAEERCGGCHATSRGELSQDPEAPPFADVVKEYPPENLEEALAEGIMVGHPDMPEFKFSADEVKLLIEYLKSLE